mmetsp:Transcript_27145/g.62712  ORF Transcript_27145/g.62712 Transcript_27145/m.62712 type:complete len:211 (-) Transcript_27145:91-723(-)
MGAEPVLSLLEAAFSELFGHISADGNLTKETYEALSDDMRGSMGDSYDTFLQRVSFLGIEVKPEVGLTRQQYVQMNTKHFAGMAPERLAEVGPTALEHLNETLAAFASPRGDAAIGEGLRKRMPEARWLQERKETEEEATDADQHGALFSFFVMLALLATWAILAWLAWTAVEAYRTGAFWVPALLLFCPLPVYFWIKMLNVVIKPRKVS